MSNRSQKPYNSLLKSIIDSQKPYYCNVDRIFGCRGLDLSLLYKLQMIWPRLKISTSSTFDEETLHKGHWKWGAATWTLDACGQNTWRFFKNHPSHQTGSRHWSVVSCVRCGCVGAGLGFPVGASASLRFTPPTSDLEHDSFSTKSRNSLKGYHLFCKIMNGKWHVETELADALLKQYFKEIMEGKS